MSEDSITEKANYKVTPLVSPINAPFAYSLDPEFHHGRFT